jgi:hypothetical protein
MIMTQTIDRRVPVKTSLQAIAWLRCRFGPLTPYQVREIERRLDAARRTITQRVTVYTHSDMQPTRVTINDRLW